MDEPELQQQLEAAAVCEEFFVPAFFHEWAVRTADRARIGPGHQFGLVFFTDRIPALRPITVHIAVAESRQ
jgi:hypothetical protein